MQDLPWVTLENEETGKRLRDEQKPVNRTVTKPRRRVPPQSRTADPHVGAVREPPKTRGGEGPLRCAARFAFAIFAVCDFRLRVLERDRLG